jgi:pimeloyl-ACP methyl ester carboxylesterase
MKIDSLEAVQLGDSTQWIHIRGEDSLNPVLLLIQQGPGLPMMNEIRRFEATLGLEKQFTVVYWDQRGCGRTLRGRSDPSEISLQQMTEDTVGLLELLRERFATKSYVLGFSMGATVGAYAVARRPDLATVLIAVGADVDGVAAGKSAYDFALETARQRGKKRAVRQLEKIGPPPHLTVKQFATRVRWASNFQGVTTNQTYSAVVRSLLSSLLRSPDYTLGDVLREIRGITTTQAALLHEMNELCLDATVLRLDVPFVMVQGRLDMVAPGGAAQRYFDALESPSKKFVWFENSAHTPQLDEPERFRDLIIQIREGQRSSSTFVESNDQRGSTSAPAPLRFIPENSETLNESGGSR